MKRNLKTGKRVIKNSLVFTTAFATCVALQANDPEKPASQSQLQDNPPGQELEAQSGLGAGQKGEKGSNTSQQASEKGEKFVQKSLMSHQSEVQMVQLAQQKAENQQVKQLAETIMRDHQQAGEKLRQIAADMNVKAGQGVDPGEHKEHTEKSQQTLQKLRDASGAEFDKQFVTAMLKCHKKDISEFEKAQQQVQNQELKSFIQETLPKLRNHYQMAQAAARTVGVDEAAIAADIDEDESAVGAPAGTVRGTDKLDSDQDSNLDVDTELDVDKDRSSLDGAIETDPSGTINQNNTRADDLSADADLDVDTSGDGIAVDADADVDDGGIFEKGDGKVLGLPTDKNDGKFLGIIPNPRANNDADVDVDVDKDPDAQVDVDVDTDDDSAIGSPATTESGTETNPK